MRRLSEESFRRVSEGVQSIATDIYNIYIYIFLYIYICVCVNCTDGFMSVNGVSGSELRGRSPSCEQDPRVEIFHGSSLVYGVFFM